MGKRRICNRFGNVASIEGLVYRPAPDPKWLGTETEAWCEPPLTASHSHDAQPSGLSPFLNESRVSNSRFNSKHRRSLKPFQHPQGRPMSGRQTSDLLRRRVHEVVGIISRISVSSSIQAGSKAALVEIWYGDPRGLGRRCERGSRSGASTLLAQPPGSQQGGAGAQTWLLTRNGPEFKTKKWQGLISKESCYLIKSKPLIGLNLATEEGHLAEKLESLGSSLSKQTKSNSRP